MIKSMDAVELKKKIDSNEEIVLIDCREQDEWDAGHINEAIFIPLSKFLDEAKEKLTETEKNATIIIQCRSGKRSLMACCQLEEQGFSDLTNLEGGILGWMDEGFEVKR